MSNPPTAAELEAQRAQAAMNNEEDVFKRVSKDHQAAVKAWEKLTVKQKKITTSADSAVAKLEKQVKEYEAQSDKTHKKIADLRKKQEYATSHESSKQSKASAEIQKHEAKVQKAQTKLREAIAKKSPPKTLYKLQQAIDDELRAVEMAKKKAELVPQMVRLEVQELENKILALSISAENDLAKTKLKLRETQYDRDLKIAKLEPDLVAAQLAVQQYEGHLASHRQDLMNAQQNFKEADAVAHQPPEPEPEPVRQPEPEPVPEPQPEPHHEAGEGAEHAGEGEEGRRESEFAGEGDEGRRESEFGAGDEGRRESEFGAGEEGELPAVPSLPSVPAPAQ